MEQSETPSTPPPPASLLQLAHGTLYTQLLCVAAQLGLAERLAQDGPINANQLALQVGTHTLILERILRALVSMNVCDELDGDWFQLTRLGEYLRPNILTRSKLASSLMLKCFPDHGANDRDGADGRGRDSSGARDATLRI